MRRHAGPGRLEPGAPPAAPAAPETLDAGWNLPARMDVLPSFRCAVTRLAKMLGFNRSAQYRLVLAAHEAVANAVEHGSPGPDCTIRVGLSAGPQAVTVRVCNEGVLPAGRATRPSDDRGRGLALIGALMDELRVDEADDGVLVEFSQSRTAPAAGADARPGDTPRFRRGTGESQRGQTQQVGQHRKPTG